MDAITSRLRSDIDYWIADACGGREENLVGIGDADRHRVNQDITVIGRMKIDLASYCWHTNAVTVSSNSGDNAAYLVTSSGMIGCAET